MVNVKKIIAVIITISLLIGIIPALAVSDGIDLTGMSFDDLIALRQQVNMAIWQSDGWQSVEVPAGIYQVGVDIPAGKWQISVENRLYGEVKWGDLLSDSGADLVYKGATIYEDVVISSQDTSSRPTSVVWELTEGTYFYSSAKYVVFTPYIGASLGFK